MANNTKKKIERPTGVTVFFTDDELREVRIASANAGEGRPAAFIRGQVLDAIGYQPSAESEQGREQA